MPSVNPVAIGMWITSMVVPSGLPGLFPAALRGSAALCSFFSLLLLNTRKRAFLFRVFFCGNQIKNRQLKTGGGLLFEQLKEKDIPGNCKWSIEGIEKRG